MMQFNSYFNMTYLQNLVGDALNLMRGNSKILKSIFSPISNLLIKLPYNESVLGIKHKIMFNNLTNYPKILNK